MNFNIHFIIFISLKLISTICLANRELVDHLNSIKGIPKFEYTGTLIALQDGQVDLSVLVEHVETLLRQSDYNNDRFNVRLGFLVYENIKRLCASLPSDQQVDDCLTNSIDSNHNLLLRLHEMQANRILLPDDYYPVGKIPENVAMTAHEKLQSNCLSTCKDNDIGKMLSHGSTSQYRQTIRRLTELGPSCLRMATYSLGEQLEDYNQKMRRIRFPDTCEQEIGRQKNVCERLKRDHKQITQRISDLADMIVSQNSSGTTLSLSASCLENNSSISTIYRFFKDLKNEHDCSEYQRGEEREFYPDRYSGYRVKKETDGSYTVSMAMEFSYHYLWKAGESIRDRDTHALSSSHVFESTNYQNQTHNLFMQKITECINRANVKMLGPTGEQLNIVIKDGKKDMCTPKHHIQIYKYFDRAASATYPEDIDCIDMVHEVLHKAGLKDEYEEKWRGGYVDANTGRVIRTEDGPPSEYQEAFLPDYNCRVIQNNTIMSNHTMRWNHTFAPTRPDSLLDPSHFNAILYGNCSHREDVRIYRECSELAYMTAYQNSTSNNDCPPLKAECEKQDILGIGKRKLQEDYRSLESQLHFTNSMINRMGKALITLEQAAVQTGSVDSQRFGCSYPPRRLDISVCKENLRDLIRNSKQNRDELIQKRERLRILLR